MHHGNTAHRVIAPFDGFSGKTIALGPENQGQLLACGKPFIPKCNGIVGEGEGRAVL